ncbi:hypothetical protein Ga0466249_001489 [Sporomusaceae bacterium BoRhaA]|nr:hypothetical protein [Pelorhabdus rhamnosifermentans]
MITDFIDNELEGVQKVKTKKGTGTHERKGF